MLFSMFFHSLRFLWTIHMATLSTFSVNLLLLIYFTWRRVQKRFVGLDTCELHSNIYIHVYWCSANYGTAQCCLGPLLFDYVFFFFRHIHLCLWCMELWNSYVGDVFIWCHAISGLHQQSGTREGGWWWVYSTGIWLWFNVVVGNSDWCISVIWCAYIEAKCAQWECTAP